MTKQKQSLIITGIIAAWLFLLYFAIRLHSKAAVFLLPIFAVLVVIFLVCVSFNIIKWTNEAVEKEEKTQRKSTKNKELI